MRYIIYHFAVSLHLKELYYLYKHLGQYEKQFSVVVIVYMTTIQIATVMKQGVSWKTKVKKSVFGK